MIKNPERIIIDNYDIKKDIKELIYDMDYKSEGITKIEINLIELNFYFHEWTYHINYEVFYPPINPLKNSTNSKVKSNINFYTSERHQSLDNKIEEYLDNYLTQSTRDKKLTELGIL